MDRDGRAGRSPGDMDLEGSTSRHVPARVGREWALGDPQFSRVVPHLNDAGEYAAFAPERLKLVAKLPMLDPGAEPRSWNAA